MWVRFLGDGWMERDQIFMEETLGQARSEYRTPDGGGKQTRMQVVGA